MTSAIGEVIKEDAKEVLLRIGTGEETKYPIDKVVPMNPPKFDGNALAIDCLVVHVADPRVSSRMRGLR